MHAHPQFNTMYRINEDIFSRRDVRLICSGLAHLLAGKIMEQMVLLCYIDARFLNAFKFLKFLELAGGNLLAVTNLAICINLAQIVRVSALGAM